MKRSIALVSRVECNKQSNGVGSKSNGNTGGRRLMVTSRAMAMVTAMTWVMVMVTRLEGDKEGKGKGDDDSDEGGG